MRPCLPFFCAFLCLIALVPSIGHASPDELGGCGAEAPKKAALRACDEFQCSVNFAQSKVIESANSLCLPFFETAFQANNLLCSYHKDAAGFFAKASVATKGSDVGAAYKAEARAKSLNQEGAAMHGAYVKLFAEKHQKLTKLAEQYTVAIGKMNGSGGTSELWESSCSKPGQFMWQPSPVPGLLQQGLARKSQEDLRTTLAKILPLLRQTIRGATAAARSEAAASLIAGAYGADLSTLGGQFHLPVASWHGHQLTSTESLGIGNGALAAKAQLKVPVIGGLVAGLSGYALVTHKSATVWELAELGTFAMGAVSGAVGTLVVSQAEQIDKQIQRYRAFAGKVIHDNQNITAQELMQQWAQANGASCSPDPVP